MSSLSLCVMLAGFIAIGAIFAIHFIKDMKAPAQGKQMYEALTRFGDKRNNGFEVKVRGRG